MAQGPLVAEIAITAWTEVLHGGNAGVVRDPDLVRPMTRDTLSESLLVAHDRSLGRCGGRLNLLEFGQRTQARRFGFAGAAAGGGNQRNGAGDSGRQGADHGREGLRLKSETHFEGCT